MKILLWLAKYETKNYDFEIISESKNQAKDLLIDALESHGEKFNLNENTEYERNVISWFSEDDIEVTEIHTDKLYYDGLGRG